MCTDRVRKSTRAFDRSLDDLVKCSLIRVVNLVSLAKVHHLDTQSGYTKRYNHSSLCVRLSTRRRRRPPVVAIPWLHGRRRGTPTATTPAMAITAPGRAASSTRTPPATATSRTPTRVVRGAPSCRCARIELGNLQEHLIDLWMILSSAV